jgi:hypothetical protein
MRRRENEKTRNEVKRMVKKRKTEDRKKKN